MEIKEVPEYLPSIGRLLGFANAATDLLSQKLLDAHGVSLTQWIILTALWRTDGMTVGAVAEYYRVNVPAASRALDRMEEAGLVERRPDPSSRRVVRVFLTEKARSLSHLLTFYRDINERLLRGFSAGEADQLVDMLHRLQANAQRSLDEGQA